MRLIDGLKMSLEGVMIALDAIRANRVRAGLTIMGVAVGVFVVVALSSVVRGINESFARDVAAAGPTSFFVYRRPVGGFNACDGTDDTCPERRNPPITRAEADAIERLPSVYAVTSHAANGGRFRYKDRSLFAGMEIYTANWTAVDGGDIDPGRSFTAAEEAAAARVVIINDKLAEKLFGASDPMDKAVSINGVPFTVIGLYHYTASPMGTPTSAGGGDSPKAIIPFETARRRLKYGMRGNNLIVRPKAGLTAQEAVDEVTAMLRARRGLRPGDRTNFDVVTQEPCGSRRHSCRASCSRRARDVRCPTPSWRAPTSTQWGSVPT